MQDIIISFTVLYLLFNTVENKFKLSSKFFFCPVCFAMAGTWNIMNVFYLLGYAINTYMLGALIAMSFVGSWYQFCYYFTKGKEILSIELCDIVTYLWFIWAIILISSISNKIIFEPMIIIFDLIMIYILIKSPKIIKEICKK